MIFLLACKTIKPTVVQEMAKVFLLSILKRKLSRYFYLERTESSNSSKVHEILSKRTIQPLP